MWASDALLRRRRGLDQSTKLNHRRQELMAYLVPAQPKYVQSFLRTKTLYLYLTVQLSLPVQLPRTPAIMPAFTESRAAAEPPLAESYLDLLRRGGGGIAPPGEGRVAVQERELPLIDLGCLMTTSGQQGSRSAREARAACAYAMARAASEWGFFQVTGHGVGRALLERLRAEQARLFRLPFETKARAGLLNGSYRWGAPTATSLRHLSWSEAFHVPLASISGSGCDFGELGSLS
uniref:Non-haem dioxygenase N-terminal domain-containing protein n=1 Tax=Setaria viridis TaxID=4556 RepID=A0A4U6TWF7_SETVI|nr:hypothetical protein SEVIR_7G180800v2 [Setaria viridis]